jgi:hypothetical protein
VVASQQASSRNQYEIKQCAYSCMKTIYFCIKTAKLYQAAPTHCYPALCKLQLQVTASQQASNRNHYEIKQYSFSCTNKIISTSGQQSCIKLHQHIAI